MTIEELITFCEKEEYNHRLKCKRYDDASGYTRSKDKNIRTDCAIREATYADFYKEISDTMRKYQKIEQYELFVEMITRKNTPSVTPQEPKTGYISIDDVMSVFDDFMCGEADEEGTETFWEMLKDKAESEGE